MICLDMKIEKQNIDDQQYELSKSEKKSSQPINESQSIAIDNKDEAAVHKANIGAEAC